MEIEWMYKSEFAWKAMRLKKWSSVVSYIEKYSQCYIELRDAGYDLYNDDRRVPPYAQRIILKYFG